METQDIYKIFLGVAILALLVTVITAFSITFLSTFSTVITATNATATLSSPVEIFNNTALALHTVDNPPIVAVTYFGLSTLGATYNDVSLAGNGTINKTISKSFTLSTPLDTGTVSAAVWTVRVAGTLGSGSTVNVSVDGTNLGNAITGIQNFTVPISKRVTPLVVNYTMVGVNYSTITNTTLEYYVYRTNTNYTVQNAATGKINTTVTGNFRIIYSYYTTLANGIDDTTTQSALQSGITTLGGIPGWLGLIILSFIMLVVLSLIGLVLYAVSGMGGGQQ